PQYIPPGGDTHPTLTSATSRLFERRQIPPRPKSLARNRQVASKPTAACRARPRRTPWPVGKRREDWLLSSAHQIQALEQQDRHDRALPAPPPKPVVQQDHRRWRLGIQRCPVANVR